MVFPKKCFFNVSIGSNISVSNGRVQPKLVLVLTNGSVWNIKFNSQMNMINKELLIQLPKHYRYHVFQTDSNVLNFVRDDINKSIVQFHEKLSNVGYILGKD